MSGLSCCTGIPRSYFIIHHSSPIILIISVEESFAHRVFVPTSYLVSISIINVLVKLLLILTKKRVMFIKGKTSRGSVQRKAKGKNIELYGRDQGGTCTLEKNIGLRDSIA